MDGWQGERAGGWAGGRVRACKRALRGKRQWSMPMGALPAPQQASERERAQNREHTSGGHAGSRHQIYLSLLLHYITPPHPTTATTATSQLLDGTAAVVAVSLVLHR